MALRAAASLRPMRFAWLISLLPMVALACDRPSQDSSPSSEPPAPAEQLTPAAHRPRHPAPVREGGTLARAAENDALFVADEDHGAVRLVPLPVDVQNPPRELRVPGQPAQVLALDGRVLVTVRSEGAPLPGTKEAQELSDKPFPGEQPTVPSATGPGLLLILERNEKGDLVESARVRLPQDAWGVAVSPDESIAVVTSAWAHKVSAVDIDAARLLWTVDVPREPRAAVIREDGDSAYITHLTGAALTRIDGLHGEPSVHSVDLPASPLRAPIGKKNGASLAYSALLSPDGKRLFVARHALGAEGPQAWFGAATVDVLNTVNDTPLAPSRSTAPPAMMAEAATMLEDPFSGRQSPRSDPVPFVQPRAMVYRKKSSSLLVASEGDSRLVALDATAADPTMHLVQTMKLSHKEEDARIFVPSTCGAPSGLALSEDEDTAWVFCRSTYDLLVWSFSWDGPRPTLRLAEDMLPEEAALGRRIFYDSTDDVTSGGLGCAGCHPEGRDDGFVWHETKGVTWDQAPTFVGAGENVPNAEAEDSQGYPRQTPMLAGRVRAEGPYGWHAESPTLTARLRGGFGLHRWSGSFSAVEQKDIHQRAMALRAYLRLGLVPPPRRDEPLTDQEERGKELFLSDQTGCTTCHVPDTGLTDREAYAPYGGMEPPRGFADDPEKRYKTPSLLFVGGTAPYMHDGRFSSLRSLLDLNANRMGHTSHLTPEDKDALAAYLETL